MCFDETLASYGGNDVAKRCAANNVWNGEDQKRFGTKDAEQKQR
jgi:hypothetical protein